MSAYREIFEWSSSLPNWQQDALRRLFGQDALTEKDYAELVELAKTEAGIIEKTELVAKPLSSSYSPGIDVHKKVVLKSLKNLTNVNQIAPDQKLDFSEDGLTVVYGGNGSGKSGYTRVLKNACRARDQKETVLADAYDSDYARKIPEATFELVIDGDPLEVKWIRGTQSPEELSSIAVFDSHCARLHISEKQTIEYLPYGLEALKILGEEVIPRVKQALTKEIEDIVTSVDAFLHLSGDTTVGKEIASLSYKSEPDRIKQLAKLTEQEEQRLTTLKKTLAADNPAEMAKLLRQKVVRFKELVKKLEDSGNLVSDEKIASLSDITVELLAAEDAEKLAAKDLHSNEELLPGTGGKAWKKLFEAARSFADNDAYCNHKFPHSPEGALCPLCQQPISDVIERMRRFDNFIKDTASQYAERERGILKETIESFKKIEFYRVLEGSISDELSEIDPEIVDNVTSFLASVVSRRSWILNASSTMNWSSPPALCEVPRQVIRTQAAILLCEARAFDRSANSAKRPELDSEKDELQKRQQLSLIVNSIISTIKAMQMKQNLTNLKNKINSGTITKKVSGLAKTYITDQLRETLVNEFHKLGVGHIKLDLDQKGLDCKPTIQLKLEQPTDPKLRIDQILSEGEQRAIAVASFLAELQLAKHTSGIVFDDPVTSLEHTWREKIAKRLVHEATDRQVVIFTHDTVFLQQIRDQREFKNNRGKNRFYTLVRESNPGVVENGLPWGHQSIRERIDYLLREQRKLERDWSGYPTTEQEERIRTLYGLLRATVERSIQDDAFNRVVQRFSDHVSVNNLKKVSRLTPEQCQVYMDLHNDCSTYIPSHDHSAEGMSPSPAPSDLGRDIQRLVDLRNSFNDSKEE